MSRGKGGWKWFGAKTLYRMAPQGKPKGMDRRYSAGATMVEERVVLVRARSDGEALNKAEREASEYARSRYRNSYGQQVVTRYLGYCSLWEIDSDKLKAGDEIFSVTESIPARISDSKVVARLIGAPESPSLSRQRFMISNIIWNQPAPGVRLNKAERRSVALYEALRSKKRESAYSPGFS